MTEKSERQQAEEQAKEELQDAGEFAQLAKMQAARAADLAEKAKAEAEAAHQQEVARLRRVEEQVRVRAVESVFNEQLMRAGIRSEARALAMREIVSQLRDVEVDDDLFVFAKFGERDEIDTPRAIVERFLKQHPYMAGEGTPTPGPGAPSGPGTRAVIEANLRRGEWIERGVVVGPGHGTMDEIAAGLRLGEENDERPPREPRPLGNNSADLITQGLNDDPR